MESHFLLYLLCRAAKEKNKAKEQKKAATKVRFTFLNGTGRKWSNLLVVDLCFRTCYKSVCFKTWGQQVRFFILDWTKHHQSSCVACSISMGLNCEGTLIIWCLQTLSFLRQCKPGQSGEAVHCLSNYAYIGLWWSACIYLSSYLVVCKLHGLSYMACISLHCSLVWTCFAQVSVVHSLYLV